MVPRNWLELGLRQRHFPHQPTIHKQELLVFAVLEQAYATANSENEFMKSTNYLIHSLPTPSFELVRSFSELVHVLHELV